MRFTVAHGQTFPLGQLLVLGYWPDEIVLIFNVFLLELSVRTFDARWWLVKSLILG